MSLFCFIIFIFFSSVGLIYFFTLLQYIFFSDVEKYDKVHCLNLIVVRGHMDDLEFLVRKHMFKHNDYFQKSEVIFVNAGLDEETEQVLKKLSQTYNFTICAKEQVYETILKKIEKI